jgi:4-hydroxybenzoyl-CoA thioesterase
MITLRRPIRFEEVDAAGIVFFARYLNLCHEAMEHFFAGLEGGYSHLIMQRDIGLPAVAANILYHAPLRYGDTALIEIGASHIGTTSCALIYRLRKESDGVKVATVRHNCVLCTLSDVRKIAIPADVRQILEAHRTEDPWGTTTHQR